MIYNQDTYSLVIPQHISYTDLMGRVEQKLHVVGDLRSTSPRLKYQDEDGDFITINSDDDIQLAFESYNYSNIRLFVCLSH
jgi:cell division control protein 24